MSTPRRARPVGRGWWARGRARLHQWAHLAHTGLWLLALATWPASYSGPARVELNRQLWRNTWPQWPAFLLMGSLLGVVLIHIVWVTAQSYGLSHVALEVLVRVLALELLPLLAALFVALRCSLPLSAELMATAPVLQPGSEPNVAATVWRLWLAQAVFPRALAVVFTVWLLVASSAVVSLLLAYVMVHGWSPWGAGPFAHTVGRVFSPGVTVVFLLKTLAFSLAVGVVPMAQVASSLRVLRRGGVTPLAALARLTGVLLLFEVLALLAYI